MPAAPRFGGAPTAACDSITAAPNVRDGKPTSFALFAAPGRKVDGTLADAPPPTLPAEAPLREGSKLVFAEESPVVKGLAVDELTLWVAVKNSRTERVVLRVSPRRRRAGGRRWAPNASVLATPMRCREVAFRLPSLRTNGCAADESLEVEMREHQTPMDAKGGGGKGGGGGGEWRAAKTREEGDVVTVGGLDPAVAYEFRTVAYNAAGRTPSESSGAAAAHLPPSALLSPPLVEPTSSRSLWLDWSRLASGCADQVTWRARPPPGRGGRRVGGGGAGAQGDVARPRDGVRGGCAFKVAPNVAGWTQASAACRSVRTPALPPPSPATSAWSSACGPRRARSSVGRRHPPRLRGDVRAALRGPRDGRVAALEIRQADGVDAYVFDLRGGASGGGAQRLVDQIRATDSALRGGVVTSYTLWEHGVARLYEQDGTSTEKQLAPEAAMRAAVAKERAAERNATTADDWRGKVASVHDVASTTLAIGAAILLCGVLLCCRRGCGGGGAYARARRRTWTAATTTSRWPSTAAATAGRASSTSRSSSSRRATSCSR